MSKDDLPEDPPATGPIWPKVDPWIRRTAWIIGIIVGVVTLTTLYIIPNARLAGSLFVSAMICSCSYFVFKNKSWQTSHYLRYCYAVNTLLNLFAVASTASRDATAYESWVFGLQALNSIGWLSLFVANLNAREQRIVDQLEAIARIQGRLIGVMERHLGVDESAARLPDREVSGQSSDDAPAVASTPLAK